LGHDGLDDGFAGGFEAAEGAGESADLGIIMAQKRIDCRTLELARFRQGFFDEIGGCFARDSQFARGVGEMEEMNFL